MEAMMSISVGWLLSVYPWCQRGKVVCPLLIFDCFFLCNLVQFIIWAFHSLALWHLSNVDVLITGLGYCVSVWCPISSCCPNVGHSECRKLFSRSIPTFANFMESVFAVPRKWHRKIIHKGYIIMITGLLDIINICFHCAVISVCF